MSKTHYRKVYKSDHLGSADLEDMIEAGVPLVFTIREVRQERGVRVAGSKGDHNIAYFEGKHKPWVINATNAKILKGFAGSAFVEDWAGLTIQLYIDPSVKMKGEVVGGVRVMPQMPQPVKKELTPAMSQAWNNAKAAYKRDGNLDKVKERMTISQENELQLIGECQ